MKRINAKKPVRIKFIDPKPDDNAVPVYRIKDDHRRLCGWERSERLRGVAEIRIVGPAESSYTELVRRKTDA